MGNINKTAIAQIRLANDNIIGYITLNETDNNNTIISGNLSGLIPGYHAIHIHEKGNPIKCCDKLGDHYNPFNKLHGGRTFKNIFDKEIINFDRHVGDLGNIKVESDGTCKFKFEDTLVKLSGEYSVIGRSIVIHENEDDLGLSNHIDSKTTGNSGKRIAYGIIGYQ